MLNSKHLSVTVGTSGRRSAALCATIVAALSMAASGVARADSEMDALKKQVQELQQKIDAMAAKQAAAPAAVPAAAPAAAAPAAPASGSLSAYGVSLYGIVDVGLQYESFGAPISDYFPAGTTGFLQKNSRQSMVSLVPSALGQSRVGLQGKENLVDGWSAVFKLETFFNPQSGEISDALKSQALNNGRALNQQSTNVDSSITGTWFNSAAYGGISNAKFGTLTFGRQNTLLADGVAKYDPMGASNAFSVIGYSGATAGGGDTQNRRLDNSLKYVAQFGALHFGSLYQFSGTNGSAGTAWQLMAGGNSAQGSVDVFWVKKEQAIATAPLSACQLQGTAVLGAACKSPGLATLGLSPGNTLAATISDNTAFSVMGSYSFGKPKVFGGYEHISYANPNTPLVAPATAATATAGFPTTIGGYVLGYTNNAAFANNKILEVYWAGVKYTFNPKSEATLAYYRYNQSAFGTGALAGCNTASSGTCSGRLAAYSFVYDYRLTKRFDTYFGAMWSSVYDGLSSGYLQRATIDPTIGVRYTF